MAEFIDREKVISIIEERQKALCPVGMYGRCFVYGTDREKYDAWDEIIEDLERIPEADVAPVMHGKWVEGIKKVKDWRGRERDMWFPMMCSVCGMGVPVGSKYKFCPYCGTTMLEVSK